MKLHQLPRQFYRSKYSSHRILEVTEDEKPGEKGWSSRSVRYLGESEQLFRESDLGQCRVVLLSAGLDRQDERVNRCPDNGRRSRINGLLHTRVRSLEQLQ